MRIDVIVESCRTAQDFVELGRLAESCGLGGVWVANSSNGRDAFVNLVPLAQKSERIRMGPIAVSPFELHPYRMALSLLTLNEIAGGRAQVVVGAGGGVAEAIGKRPKRVLRPVRECVEILSAAANGDAISYPGEDFPISWFDTRWVTQPEPMIYVGANGPNMLAAAARYAPGIMLSDFVPQRVRWARELIEPVLRENGRDPARFPLNNFWAWHVKDSREAAVREARIWLCVRGTIYEDYIRDVVSDDEARVVSEHIDSFAKAFYRKRPEIDGVPDEIVNKIVDRGTSASCIADIDREVERFREFERAGLTEIALRVYDEPDEAIRTIGEHIVPALS